MKLLLWRRRYVFRLFTHSSHEKFIWERRFLGTVVGGSGGERERKEPWECKFPNLSMKNRMFGGGKGSWRYSTERSITYPGAISEAEMEMLWGKV